MTTGRYLRTATLLPDGKVLVAGGYFSEASAEVYDPVTGAWSATGSMTAMRIKDTATLLPTGKVLVAGGFQASAELYDPIAGVWSATGSMTNARGDHTATLLSNGKVLVAGGCCPTPDNNSTMARAELYDPAAGTWSVTGSMTTAHADDTATRLSGGNVLVAGGDSGFSRATARAELYDPVAGTWSVTGSMTTGRSAQTATLLPSGKVLVVGGHSAVSNSTMASAELYDPAAIPATSCGLTRSGTDATGHTFIDIAVQDTNSGLRLVKVTESTNASVMVPTFAVGTTSSQVVVATKVDQARTSQVALQVTNFAGQVTNCDPILTEVGRHGPHGVPRVETFHRVTQGESQVTILNGAPGLTRLRLVVDGHVFEMSGLTDGESRLVDVSAAMRRGDNTLTLIAQGRTDGTASILIADQ